MKKFMLRMRERRTKMKGGREFKQAAFTYMGLKMLLLVITYFFMTCESDCEASNIIRPLIHMILGSHFIYAGMRITSTILGAISFFRATAYLINFFFKKSLLLTLPVTGTQLSLLSEQVSGNWVFLFEAFTMYIISWMIFRAVRARFMKSKTVEGPLPALVP